jgi:type IV secretion system protein VirB10
MLMIFSSHQKTKPKPLEDGSLTDMGVLDNNKKTLNQMLNHKNIQTQPSQNFEFSGFDNTESKEMVERRNAPTQMFATDNNSTQLGDQGNAPATSSVLPGQGPYSQYVSSQQTQTDTVRGTKIKNPPYTIAEGEFIHATLETAINSDLPGMVRAVIKDPVYAYVGEQPLIPAGSRLIGQYFSMSSNGAATTRLFIIWNRIITPDGISIIINSPGTDGLGQAGMEADAIDSHFLKIFGTASLLSIIGASAATNGVNDYDQPNSANMYRQGISQAFQQSAQTVLNQNLNIKPTLHIYQGDDVNVFVAHDVDLYDILGPSA